MGCWWDVSEIGELKKLCGAVEVEGKTLCAAHQARVPFWPTGEIDEVEKVQTSEVGGGVGRPSGGADGRGDKVDGSLQLWQEDI